MKMTVLMLLMVAGMQFCPIAYAEEPELIILNVGKSLKGEMAVKNKTSDTLVVFLGIGISGWPEKGREVPTADIRYIVYHNYAIPYDGGIAQPRVGIFREIEHPNDGAMVLGLAGFGIAVWQYIKFRDDEKAINALDYFGYRDSDLEKERDKHLIFTAVAGVGGLLFAAMSTETNTTLKLPDGTLLSASPSPRYPGLLLAYHW